MHLNPKELESVRNDIADTSEKVRLSEKVKSFTQGKSMSGLGNQLFEHRGAFTKQLDAAREDSFTGPDSSSLREAESDFVLAQQLYLKAEERLQSEKYAAQNTAGKQRTSSRRFGP